MMPGGPGGDWKSRSADQLQRRGRGDSAKALIGTGRKKRRRGEMTRSQMREEGERREAMPEPRPMSLWARLLALFSR